MTEKDTKQPLMYIRCTVYRCYSIHSYIQARLAKNGLFFGQHLSRDYSPPGHENPAMGFFGGVDQDSMVGAKKKLFLMLFLLKKTVKSSSDGRAHLCNRSGVVELVGREPWIITRVENGVTKFSPQRQ